MASVGTSTPPSSHGGGGINMNALKHIDINQLTLSELQALALCSNSSINLQPSDDVISPQLDRSHFNESAGSRRQTFSRLHHRSHSRFPGLHPSLKPHRELHPLSDPVTHSIVHFFKHFVNGNHNPPPPPPPPILHPQEVTAPMTNLGFEGLRENLTLKGKKARKRRNSERIFENRVSVELQKVNAKAELVDFSVLEEKGDELYNEELKRRTEGLDTEEGVLGFLWGLDGQWCSRRKKRKYVDAGVFGDALPIGWKILLGLRRRDYRVSLYCRRYISPTGHHFLSCREAASFLNSYFSGNDADQQKDQKTCSIQQAYIMSSSVKDVSPADRTHGVAYDTVPHSTSARSSTIAPANDDSLMGIKNLPEVQVQDIYECSKCNLTFDEKNVYLQHLFTCHQKTTKRYRIGERIGEGVIIRDGKYECQFCHKVFEQKRSYSSHVGVHVRGKNSNELPPLGVGHKSPESPLEEALPSKSLKMNALIEIAQSSIFGNSEIGTSEQPITDQSAEVSTLKESLVACSDHEANLASDPIKIQAEDFEADRAPSEHLNHSNQAITKTNDMVSNEYQWNINVNMDANCSIDSEHVGASDIGNYGNNNLETGLESNDHLEDTPGLPVQDIVFQDGNSSVAMAPQSFQFFPTFDSAPNKVEHEFSVVDQKLENVMGFEELRFEDIDPFKYNFVNGPELSLPGCSMNLGNYGGIEDGFNSSVRFHSEEVMLNTLETSQLTVCVWCRTEFRLEGIESETPSDSIGYMCPTCKAKISGHFSGGLSLDPHGF